LPRAMSRAGLLWSDSDNHDPDPQELNPDCGTKSTIARSVSMSPQRYSSAFGSQVPRFNENAYYGQHDPRALAAKPRGTQRAYDAFVQQPRIGVKDPTRGSPQFTSTVSRFNNGLGTHPNRITPLPSFAPGSGLDMDREHWKRNGFFHPRGPRLPQTAPTLTSGLEPANLSAAAEHVDSMVMSLQQAVSVSPKRLKNMSSRTSRFIAPLNFTAGDPRWPNSLHPPYQNSLGPGSYDVRAQTAMVINEPGKPQNTFASGSPRLKPDPLPMNVGSNLSSLELDERSRAGVKIYMAKGKSGRVVPGPQPGSYEDMKGLGRATSPERRSPDVPYNSEASIQKRPLHLEVKNSPLKFSPAFRSHAVRLALSYDETRSLEYPTAATDQFDLATLATSRASMASLHSADGGVNTQPFASTAERFPRVLKANDSEQDLVEHARKRWLSPGQPMTAHSDRFAHMKTNEAETSPGPGTYIKPKQWESHEEKVLAKDDMRSARRRLDVSAAA